MQSKVKAAVLLVGFWAVAALAIQERAFEVASVKQSTAQSPPLGIKRTTGQFTVTSASLPFLIRWAYDLDQDRLFGIPKGLDSATFDIIAKIPDGALAPGDLQRMMRSLLAERFKLRVHTETRELSSYALVTESGGSKVRFVETGEGIRQNPFNMTDRGRLVGTKVMPAMLAKVLAEQIGRPVVDQTEIKMPFDFVLEWNPIEQGDQFQSRPSIFTAVREQLGFRLNARKSAVEVIVIDAVERMPTRD